ncbi:MAG: hypothetical protein IPG68_11265 [Micrococcales bacterium]|nr:hypothetical protein [Micrococcales bacterium]
MSQKADRNTTYLVAAVVLAIATIQMLLPDQVTIGARWLIPAVEVIGVPAALFFLQASGAQSRRMHRAVTSYLSFLVMASVLNASLLFISMLRGEDNDGATLLFGGFGVLTINVLSFGLVYWWTDGGGPQARAHGEAKDLDFQFPQQAAGMTWTPLLPDYLFTAYTNIIAFSPTDTMPLSHRAKFLFTVQSTVSLVTILVTVSHAINLIN